MTADRKDRIWNYQYKHKGKWHLMLNYPKELEVAARDAMKYYDKYGTKTRIVRHYKVGRWRDIDDITPMTRAEMRKYSKHYEWW